MNMLPRWAGALLAAVLLILAATLLVPALLPSGGVAAFFYYALLIVGVAVGCYGLYLLVVWLTGGPRHPRDRAV